MSRDERQAAADDEGVYSSIYHGEASRDDIEHIWAITPARARAALARLVAGGSVVELAPGRYATTRR